MRRPVAERPRSPMRRQRVRIATVYRRGPIASTMRARMSYIRWMRVSEALARLGYTVDIITDSPDRSLASLPNLQCSPYSAVDWRRYDVVKTLFHMGVESLIGAGGGDHPFIISKLGSVVGPTDKEPGVYFFGDEWRALAETQEWISRHSQYLTVLTEPSMRLWQRQFGTGQPLLLVPTGVDPEIPAPRHNPYAEIEGKVAVYIGNLYEGTQREVNLYWQHRLNAIGRLLRRRGIQLCVLGPGQVDQLDAAAVTWLGHVDNEAVWDYQYFADVGIVLAQGPVQHNESSKIYYYLRSGLPVVSEAPVPNNDLIHDLAFGYVAEYGADEQMADLIERAARQSWQKEKAMRYLASQHSWDCRCQIYDELLRREFGLDDE